MALHPSGLQSGLKRSPKQAGERAADSFLQPRSPGAAPCARGRGLGAGCLQLVVQEKENPTDGDCQAAFLGNKNPFRAVSGKMFISQFKDT